MPGVVKLPTSRAGSEMSMIRLSRSLPSTVHTWDAPSVGFPSPAYSCARATAGLTTKMASGPPERGLFQYHYKIEGGKLLIKAGEMPTPGRAANLKRGGTTCA